MFQVYPRGSRRVSNGRQYYDFRVVSESAPRKALSHHKGSLSAQTAARKLARKYGPTRVQVATHGSEYFEDAFPGYPSFGTGALPRSWAANPKRHNPPLLHVHGRGWIQESYDTGSPELRRRAKSLRAAGYSVNSFSLGSQVTQWGRAKLTMLDIRPGSSGDPYLENVGRQDNPKPRGLKRLPASRMWALQRKTGQGWDTRVVGPDRRSIEGTTRWYQDNYPPASQWRSVQLGSQDNPSIRDSKKRWIKELHKHWPGLSKEAELKERAALSRILKGAGKTPRALRARSKFNPSSRSLLYDVTVPPTASERGYQFTIRARTAGAALREARRYCARNAGMTAAGYKLPRGSSARVMQTR